MSSSKEVAVLGVGMHPWGKWGRNFVEYGVHAARAALADAGLEWTDVQFVAGGDTMRNGYPGYVAGATFAQALGWSGAQVASTYGACATGAQAIDVARARILAGLCDVALVVGADTTPKGFFAPTGGERTTDPDWLRFRLLGATNPIYFGLYARRRMELYGATDARLRAGQGEEQPPRLHQSERALPKKLYTIEEVLASPIVSDPLRLLEICATSDGGAARRAHQHGVRAQARDAARCAIAAVSTVTPRYPNTVIEMPNFATDSAVGVAVPGRAVPRLDRARRLRAGGHRPRGHLRSPRSTTSRPRSSSTGTRTSASASRARPSSCCATATPRSAAACR